MAKRSSWITLQVLCWLVGCYCCCLPEYQVLCHHSSPHKKKTTMTARDGEQYTSQANKPAIRSFNANGIIVVGARAQSNDRKKMHIFRYRQRASERYVYNKTFVDCNCCHAHSPLLTSPTLPCILSINCHDFPPPHTTKRSSTTQSCWKQEEFRVRSSSFTN